MSDEQNTEPKQQWWKTLTKDIGVGLILTGIVAAITLSLIAPKLVDAITKQAVDGAVTWGKQVGKLTEQINGVEKDVLEKADELQKKYKEIKDESAEADARLKEIQKKYYDAFAALENVERDLIAANDRVKAAISLANNTESSRQKLNSILTVIGEFVDSDATKVRAELLDRFSRASGAIEKMVYGPMFDIKAIDNSDWKQYQGSIGTWILKGKADVDSILVLHGGARDVDVIVDDKELPERFWDRGGLEPTRLSHRNVPIVQPDILATDGWSDTITVPVPRGSYWGIQADSRMNVRMIRIWPWRASEKLNSSD